MTYENAHYDGIELTHRIELRPLGDIHEAGLSRVVSHASKRPFAILTAFRDKYDVKQNRQRNRSLLSILKKVKAGPILLTGHWQEAPTGMDYKDAVRQGKVKDVAEESFFVPMPDSMEFEAFEKKMADIMRAYNQDAIVLGRPGEGAWLKFQGGGSEKIGSLSVGKTSQAYSKMRRKNRNTPFVFEGTARPGTMVESMAFCALGLNWFGK